MLNIPRVNLRKAVNLMRGIELSKGGQLPFDLLDAVASSEDEAQAMQTDINVQILIDETLAARE